MSIRHRAMCERHRHQIQTAISINRWPNLVAEKSRSLNMQGFNRRVHIIQLGEAYRCFAGIGDARHSSRTSARCLFPGWRAFHFAVED